MNPEKVDHMLNVYREYVGRCGHLETAIQSMEIEIAAMKAESIEEMALKARTYTAISRGSGVGDPTARVGTALALEEYPSYIQDMEREVSQMRSELKQKRIVLMFVDAWLNGLPEKERWLIRRQMIDKVCWREVCILYKREYGDEYSKEGLRRIRSAALRKIYDFAK